MDLSVRCCSSGRHLPHVDDVKITKNRGRDSTWVCLLGAVRVAVNCLTLMTLKSKFSRPLEIASAGVSGGRCLLP
jgi:hypothetical protein